MQLFGCDGRVQLWLNSGCRTYSAGAITAEQGDMLKGRAADLADMCKWNCIVRPASEALGASPLGCFMRHCWRCFKKEQQHSQQQAAVAAAFAAATSSSSVYSRR